MRLNLLLLIFFFCSIFSCNEEKSYPISNTNTSENFYFRYQLAKFVVYKINAGSICDCQGEIYINDHQRDTFLLMQLDVNLLDVHFNRDTMVMFLDFFYQDKRPRIISSLYDCFSTIGVGFLKGSDYPSFAIVGHNAYIDLSDRKLDSIMVDNLNNCISMYHEVNPWLIHFVKSQ